MLKPGLRAPQSGSQICVIHHKPIASTEMTGEATMGSTVWSFSGEGPLGSAWWFQCGTEVGLVCALAVNCLTCISFSQSVYRTSFEGPLSVPRMAQGSGSHPYHIQHVNLGCLNLEILRKPYTIDISSRGPCV